MRTIVAARAMSRDFVHYFAADYRGARAKFAEAAASAGAAIETFTNPAPGPDGDPVHTDVAVLGDAGAPSAVLAVCGVHGAEGPCGSGALVGWLRGGADRGLPPSVRVVIVHAVNPHGFAWLRRVDEDNVDVDRNFVDHAAPYPESALHESLHPHLVPVDLAPETLAESEAALDRAARELGEAPLAAALWGGQHRHPDGLFFGGHRPAWSNRTFCAVLAGYLSDAARVLLVDLHSGAGPWGHASLGAGAGAGDGETERLRRWFGDQLESAPGPEGGPGSAAGAAREILHAAEVSCLRVRFGTGGWRRALAALRGDHWLHLRGNRASAEGRILEDRMRDAFYPADDDWRERVALQGRQVLDRAVRAAAEPAG